jgi:MFS transporter, OFA family, oxalate/formate antiporter
MSLPLTSDPSATSVAASSAATGLQSNKRRWVVTFAGTGINLALGVLYVWSMFKEAISKEFGWKGEQLNDPYALCCLVFSFAMILAGRCQDKLGPRFTASLGGLFVGLGLLLISQTSSYVAWVVGFGVLVGTGIGFGYSSATPAALKWFPAAKTGLIAGLVVAGFGLAPVYLSPLSKHLLATYGLRGAMFIYSVAFTAMVCALAQLLASPSGGQPAAGRNTPGPAAVGAGVPPGEVLRSPAFYLLWLIYFIGAGAGLMVIGSISGMARKSLGDAAFLAVAVMAIGNAAGRVGAGLLSDKIGRRWTLSLVLLFQALLMFLAIPVAATAGAFGWFIVLVASLIGFNYGANLSLFPAYTKDLWGLKNFGMNYGILFTAWGVGGFVLSRLQQMLTAYSGGSFTSSFAAAGGLLLLGAALTLAIDRVVTGRRTTDGASP